MNRAFSRCARAALVALVAMTLGACEPEHREGVGRKAPLIARAPLPTAELLPRALLFGNPERSAGQISPDGRWLGYVAPLNGVLNVFVSPVDDREQAKAITHDTGRGIRAFRFAQTSRHVLYARDQGGDENYQVFAVDLEQGTEKALSPRGARATIALLSPRHPDEVVLNINDRDKTYFDPVRVNLRTGAAERLLENTSFAEINLDDDFRPRYAWRLTETGGREYLERIDGEWRTWFTAGRDDALITRVAGMSADGGTYYLIDSRNRNTGGLYAIDATTKKAELLLQDRRADVAEIFTHPTTGEIQAATVNYLRTEWHSLDPRVTKDIQVLRGLGDGEVSIVGRTTSDDRWIIAYSPSDASSRYLIYDRVTARLEPWFDTRPALNGKPLVPMHPVVIESRDGLKMVSYYSLPPGSDKNGDAIPDMPVPMVLLVHGGPWSRDVFGLNPTHQWLANRGYAVLSVNFRGSTGFGKEHVNRGDLQWASAMHDDLVDAGKWAREKAITESDKVAIMGASYGGYATLIGLTLTPTFFACGVDIVGPSNLRTLLASIPPYWTPLKRTFTARVGDDQTEDGRRLLHDRSPLTYVEHIERPLLIGQGANDPRVNQAESDQIVKAMQEREIPVIYVLYPDEGHGFARPPNRLSFNAVTEAFLGTCLYGRVEPIGNDFKDSTITVPFGARMLPDVLLALPENTFGEEVLERLAKEKAQAAQQAVEASATR